MKKWITMLAVAMCAAVMVSAQSVMDRWDFNVPDGPISSQGSYSDLGAGGLTWIDSPVATNLNQTAAFDGLGDQSANSKTYNYFKSIGFSANQNETSGTYQVSFDVVSAGFSNTAALNQQATWGLGIRSLLGDDSAVRLTYEGRLNVTNETSAGVTNILADANEFQLSCSAKDFGYATSVNASFPGDTISNLNVRQVFNLDAGTYEVYYTLAPAAETLLFSGELQDSFSLGELRIASQQYNGNAIWEAGDPLAIGNIEISQLVAPIVDDGLDLIEQWDFTGDSLTGENGNEFPDLIPSVWNDVSGDDALTIAPTNDQYRTRNVTVTPGGGDMYISWTVNSWNLEELATRSSAYFGLAGDSNIGVELYNDTSTNTWAALRSGNTQLVKARVAKGSVTGTGPLQITARLDFVDSEVQLFVSSDGNGLNWTGVQWADSATIAAQYTAAFDLTTVMTAGSFAQFRMAATGLASNEQVTVDQIFIKEAPATAGSVSVSIVDKYGSTYGKNVGTVTVGTFAAAQSNDVFVLVASGSNKNHLQTNATTFVSADGGTVDAVQMFTQSSVGIWYAEVQTAGTFDANFTTVDNFTTIGAYLVRADSGGVLQIATDGQYLPKSASSVSAALAYSFGAASDGVVIESVSTAAETGASPNDLLIDYSNSGKREVASGDFGNLAALGTSWSIDQSTKLGNVGLGGIALYVDYVDPNASPSSLYSDWLGGETSNTNLLEDFDGDGVNNLVDYAVGGAANLPVQAMDGSYLQYVHVQRDAADATARGLSYMVEANTNLMDAAGWSTNEVEFVGSAADTPSVGYLTVTNRVPVMDAEKFMRLKIQFTP